ncbi:MAG: hypothetical protein ACE5GZ_03075 [Gammaproteobacteria bacterium]
MPKWHDFEAHSGNYVTKNQGVLGRYPCRRTTAWTQEIERRRS